MDFFRKNRRDLCKIVAGCNSSSISLQPESPITGQMYFDTTVDPAKPLWYNGTDWVDATGTAV